MPTLKPINLEKPRTIIEFASAIGVSKSQVSTAFSGNGRISPETRRSILEAAQRMGFEPNPHAQRIKGRSSRMIGLFSLDRDLGTGSLKIHKIQSLLNEKGYEVPLYGYVGGGEWEVERQVEILDGLCRQKPAAIIYHGGSIKPEALEGLWQYQQSGGIVVRYGPEADVPCDQ
ncbi:MAG TPA: LacI family DNA-binding transcriptional regulator, partial [Abditibacteriaceae bacterium]